MSSFNGDNVGMGGSSALAAKREVESDKDRLYYYWENALNYKIDNFSEKWSDMAQDPKRFLEVAQELRNLKREIKKCVDEGRVLSYDVQYEKGEFNFYIQKRLNYLFTEFTSPELRAKKTLKEKVDFFINLAPSKVAEMMNNGLMQNKELQKGLKKIFNVKEEDNTEMAVGKENDPFFLHLMTFHQNEVKDLAIILNAIEGGGEKPVGGQLKDLKYIIRKEGERQSVYRGH